MIGNPFCVLNAESVVCRQKILKIVAKSPESFPVSSKNVKFRKCVVTKQNTLFYHYNEKHIVVVAVFDTRQNPKKLKSDYYKL